MKSVYYFAKIVCFCTIVIPGSLLFLATLCCLFKTPHHCICINTKHEMRFMNTVMFLVMCLYILPFALILLTLDDNTSSYDVEYANTEEAMTYEPMSLVPYTDQLDQYLWDDIPSLVPLGLMYLMIYASK